MKKAKSRLGFSMAEMLIVVAIIAVLGGVSFVAVWNYQRSLGQLERDGIAKELFVAAQNHLTAAYGEGYLGLKVNGDTNPFGIRDTDEEGVCYFVVNGNFLDNTILPQMLPFGSIDETIRMGGSYILVYQPATGKMLDVFYCTRNGAQPQFDHMLTAEDYISVKALRGEAKKSARRTFVQGGNSILGWYGGEDAAELPSVTLQAPALKVVNAEKLYAEVTNPNPGISDAKLKLLITGKLSGAQKAYELAAASLDPRIKSVDNTYTVILDDIARKGEMDGLHFADIVADTQAFAKFIPGEDLEIQAVAYSTNALANIAYSTKGTTNSLFGSISGAKDKAYIGNIRHLENLDAAVSGLDDNDDAGLLNLSAAEQSDSFSWTDFQKGVRRIETKSETGTASEEGYAAVRVYDAGGNPTAEGCYLPIRPDYELTYDGKGHSISDVATRNVEHAGLFGSVTKVSEIQNLELIDFSVSGTVSAGALGGTIKDCTVTNVLVRNSADTADVNVTAPCAGGLVGDMDGTVLYSAAAVIVSGGSGTNSIAGGLIGTAAGTITGCYSGGHTKIGSYGEWVKENSYDVTGANAGGLAGISSAEVTDSYSTCSVSGTAVAGGFAGKATVGSISNCYATGLINPDTPVKYAFLASAPPAVFSGNYYYGVINEIPKVSTGGFEPLPPVSGTVTEAAIRPLDANADAYNSFVGAAAGWNPAIAYDAALVQYYGGKYCLKTVNQLNASVPDGYDAWEELFVSTHYGDWPSPEVFVINK